MELGGFFGRRHIASAMNPLGFCNGKIRVSKIPEVKFGGLIMFPQSHMLKIISLSFHTQALVFWSVFLFFFFFFLSITLDKFSPGWKYSLTLSSPFKVF